MQSNGFSAMEQAHNIALAVMACLPILKVSTMMLAGRVSSIKHSICNDRPPERLRVPTLGDLAGRCSKFEPRSLPNHDKLIE